MKEHTRTEMTESIEMIRSNGYDVVNELGRGSYGVVYMCKKDEKVVALKLFRAKDYASGEADGSHLCKVECEDEFTILKRIQQKGDAAYTPRVFGMFGNDSAGYAYSMEYIPGERLRAFYPMAFTTFTDTKDNIYVRQVCQESFRALAWLHEMGVYHGDISLNNIMISVAPLKVRLIDFGFAMTQEEALYSPELWAPGAHFYLSPEAIAMDKACDQDKAHTIEDMFAQMKAVDVWAMAVTCVGILGHLMPWSISDGTISALESIYRDPKLPNRIERSLGLDWPYLRPAMELDWKVRIEASEMSKREPIFRVS